MNRLFNWFALGLVLIAGGFPIQASSATVTDLSPQIINRIILVAGDVIDLQWDPASYPLFSGETFLRWELFGQALNPPGTRIKWGQDKTTGYYRHTGLGANQQYFYRLEVVNCVSPCTSVADERRHTVFTDSAHTNRLEGWVIKTLTMKPMEVQVGTGEVDYNLTVQDGATFNIGSGAKLNKGSALPKILVRNSTLNIDGAEINGIATINFGNYDPAYWGAGKVVNTKFAVVPAGQDPTYIRMYGDREVVIQTNTGQLNIYGYGAKKVRIEDNKLDNSTIDFSGGSSLEIINNQLLQLVSPQNDRMVWLNDGVQATLLGNLFWYVPAEYGGLTLLYGSGTTTTLTVRSNEFNNARVTFNEGVQVDFSDNLVRGGFGHVNIGPDYMDCPGSLQAAGSIERNTIQDGNGLDIIGPVNLSVKQNCIRNNGYGLDYGSSCNTVAQDVTANWWGHASGPWHITQNPSGLGDKINGALVSFKPFLTVETNCRSQAPPMPQDLRILGMEALQVTQTLDNSVPLVAGKKTWMRFYPEALGGFVPDVEYRFDFSRDGAPIGSRAGSVFVTRVTNLQAVRDSGDFSIAVPDEWLSGALQVTLIIDPNHKISELNESNNTRTETFVFDARRPLRILYQPIELIIEGQGLDVSPNVNKLPGLGAWIKYHYPNPDMVYKTLPYTMIWREDMKNVSLAEFIKRSDRLKNVLRDLLQTYNVNAPAGEMYDQIFGVFPGTNFQYLYACVADGSWLVNPAVAALCDDDAEIVAHEIAHNYGARHPNLGEAEDNGAVDPETDWPYANASIQEPGYNWARFRFVPRATKDLMTYWRDSFFSPHTYRTIYLNTSAALSTNPQPALPLASQEYLRVSGLVAKNGMVEFDPIFHFTSTAAPPNPPSGSTYCLELRSGANALLEQACFDLPFIYMDNGSPKDVDSFMVNLPLVAGTAKVVLTHQGGTLGQILASAHAPQVTLTTPNGGGTAGNPLPVQWTASDGDNDTLTYRLLLSTDNGASWIPLAMNLQGVSSYNLDTSLMPGTGQALLRVQASDGFHMAVDDSNATFTIAQKWPVAQITEPANGATISPEAALIGAAYDPEDGPLSGAAFAWTSSRDGSLGSGASLSNLGLSEGQHSLTLTATDSSGKSSSVSITVNVVAPKRVFLPTVNHP